MGEGGVQMGAGIGGGFVFGDGEFGDGDICLCSGAIDVELVDTVGPNNRVISAAFLQGRTQRAIIDRRVAEVYQYHQIRRGPYRIGMLVRIGDFLEQHIGPSPAPVDEAVSELAN